MSFDPVGTPDPPGLSHSFSSTATSTHALSSKLATRILKPSDPPVSISSSSHLTPKSTISTNTMPASSHPALTSSTSASQSTFQMTSTQSLSTLHGSTPIALKTRSRHSITLARKCASPYNLANRCVQPSGLPATTSAVPLAPSVTTHSTPIAFKTRSRRILSQAIALPISQQIVFSPSQPRVSQAAALVAQPRERVILPVLPLSQYSPPRHASGAILKNPSRHNIRSSRKKISPYSLPED